MPETELAKKLRVLRGTKGSRKQQAASLLFSPEQLDRLDKGAILEMATTGLMSLGSQDRRIISLRSSSLFSSASLRGDRGSIAVKDEKKLNELISECLFLLSPYLLLPSAQKPLEHLIQRYKIHVYNGTDMLRAFLPYHQTPIFARILALIVWRNEDERWQFLRAAQKKGMMVARTTLVNACVKDPAILTFVCDMAKRAGDTGDRKYNFVLSFWSCMCMETIMTMTKKSRRKVSEVLTPYLVRSISHKSRHFQTAGRMVLCKLASGNEIDQQAMSALMGSILQTSAKSHGDNARALARSLLAALSLMHSQAPSNPVGDGMEEDDDDDDDEKENKSSKENGASTFSSLESLADHAPLEAMKAILQLSALPKSVQIIAKEQFDLAPLLAALLGTICSSGLTESKNIDVLKAIAVIPSFSRFVLKALSLIVKETAATCKKGEGAQAAEAFASLVMTIDQAHPRQTSAALAALSEEYSPGSVESEALITLLNNSRHKLLLLNDNHSTMLLSAAASNSKIKVRRRAALALMEEIKSTEKKKKKKSKSKKKKKEEEAESKGEGGGDGSEKAAREQHVSVLAARLVRETDPKVALLVAKGLRSVSSSEKRAVGGPVRRACLEFLRQWRASGGGDSKANKIPRKWGKWAKVRAKVAEVLCLCLEEKDDINAAAGGSQQEGATAATDPETNAMLPEILAYMPLLGRAGKTGLQVLRAAAKRVSIPLLHAAKDIIDGAAKLLEPKEGSSTQDLSSSLGALNMALAKSQALAVLEQPDECWPVVEALIAGGGAGTPHRAAGMAILAQILRMGDGGDAAPAAASSGIYPSLLIIRSSVSLLASVASPPGTVRPISSSSSSGSSKTGWGASSSYEIRTPKETRAAESARIAQLLALAAAAVSFRRLPSEGKKMKMKKKKKKSEHTPYYHPRWMWVADDGDGEEEEEEEEEEDEEDKGQKGLGSDVRERKSSLAILRRVFRVGSMRPSEAERQCVLTKVLHVLSDGDDDDDDDDAVKIRFLAPLCIPNPRDSSTIPVAREALLLISALCLTKRCVGKHLKLLLPLLLAATASPAKLVRQAALIALQEATPLITPDAFPAAPNASERNEKEEEENTTTTKGRRRRRRSSSSSRRMSGGPDAATSSSSSPATSPLLSSSSSSSPSSPSSLLLSYADGAAAMSHVPSAATLCLVLQHLLREKQAIYATPSRSSEVLASLVVRRKAQESGVELSAAARSVRSWLLACACAMGPHSVAQAAVFGLVAPTSYDIPENKERQSMAVAEEVLILSEQLQLRLAKQQEEEEKAGAEEEKSTCIREIAREMARRLSPSTIGLQLKRNGAGSTSVVEAVVMGLESPLSVEFMQALPHSTLSAIEVKSRRRIVNIILDKAMMATVSVAKLEGGGAKRSSGGSGTEEEDALYESILQLPIRPSFFANRITSLTKEITAAVKRHEKKEKKKKKKETSGKTPTRSSSRRTSEPKKGARNGTDDDEEAGGSSTLNLCYQMVIRLMDIIGWAAKNNSVGKRQQQSRLLGGTTPPSGKLFGLLAALTAGGGAQNINRGELERAKQGVLQILSLLYYSRSPSSLSSSSSKEGDSKKAQEEGGSGMEVEQEIGKEEEEEEFIIAPRPSTSQMRSLIACIIGGVGGAGESTNEGENSDDDDDDDDDDDEGMSASRTGYLASSSSSLSSPPPPSSSSSYYDATSMSAVTRVEALKLLSSLARVHPSAVLECLTPVVEYIGKSPALAAKDTYTFAVIQQTLAAILVPVNTASAAAPGAKKQGEEKKTTPRRRRATRSSSNSSQRSDSENGKGKNGVVNGRDIVRIIVPAIWRLDNEERRLSLLSVVAKALPEPCLADILCLLLAACEEGREGATSQLVDLDDEEEEEEQGEQEDESDAEMEEEEDDEEEDEDYEPGDEEDEAETGDDDYHPYYDESNEAEHEEKINELFRLCSALMHEMRGLVQISALRRLEDMVARRTTTPLPDDEGDADEEEEKHGAALVGGVKEWQTWVASFVSTHITDDGFVAAIIRPELEQPTAVALHGLFTSTFESYASARSRELAAAAALSSQKRQDRRLSASASVLSSSSRAWAEMAEMLHATLDGLRGLLSPPLLCDALCSMVLHPTDRQVRKCALELVSATLEEEEEKMSAAAERRKRREGDAAAAATAASTATIEQLLRYLPALETIVFGVKQQQKVAMDEEEGEEEEGGKGANNRSKSKKKKQKKKQKDDSDSGGAGAAAATQEEVIIAASAQHRQSALLSIDVLARQGASKNRDVFLPLAQRVLSLVPLDPSKKKGRKHEEEGARSGDGGDEKKKQKRTPSRGKRKRKGSDKEEEEEKKELVAATSSNERDDGEEEGLASSALLCVATVVAEVGNEALALLPHLMPRLLSSLENALKAATRRERLQKLPRQDRREEEEEEEKEEEGDEGDVDLEEDEESSLVVLMSCLAVLETVTRALPKFLAPFLPKLLPLLLSRQLSLAADMDPHVKMAADKALLPLGDLVPVRLLLPPAAGWFQVAVKAGRAATGRLFGLLSSATSQLTTGDDVLGHYKRFFKLYLLSLDSRRIHTKPLISEALREDEDEGGEFGFGPLAAISSGENFVISALVALTMKLNESQLRAVFLALVQWASLAGNSTSSSTNSEADEQDPDGGGAADRKKVEGKAGDGAALRRLVTRANAARVVSVLRVAIALERRFLVIFTPYLGYVTDHLVFALSAAAPPPSVQALDMPSFYDENGEEEMGGGSSAKAKRKQRENKGRKRRKLRNDSDSDGEDEATPRGESSRNPAMIPNDIGGCAAALGRAAVQLISEWVRCDPDHTFDKSRVARLCTPLVGLLESGLKWGEGEAGYNDLVDNLMQPCITRLVQHVNDPNLWKVVNHALISKGESSQSRVRQSAIKIVAACFEAVGEEYLVLLPETMPFVAEVMEDTNEEVEAEAQKLIQVIEKLSGEDLDSYLR